MAHDEKKSDQKDVNIKDLPPKKVEPGKEDDVTGGLYSGSRTKSTTPTFDTTTHSAPDEEPIVGPHG